MHILVTGGAGFIGSHILREHMARGDKVHVVDNLSTGGKQNLEPFLENPLFRFDEADIIGWEGLDEAVSWADRIYHMAAVVGVYRVLEDPIAVLRTNITACDRLLEAARRGNWNPEMVIASSSEVYGHGLPRFLPGCEEEGGGTCREDFESRRSVTMESFSEEMEPMVGSSMIPRWNYSISKLADEAFALSYARQFGMKIMVVRFFNTVGPGQTGRYGMVVPRFVEKAVAGEPLTVYGDGTQTRSFADVRDVVKALDSLIVNPATHGDIVNVGSDREISIRELAELVVQRAGSSSTIEFVSYDKAYGEHFEETYRRRPRLDKYRRLTDYRFERTLEDTLDDLIREARERRATKDN